MSNDIFQGFTPPVSNYFRMPNEWINICAEIKSLAELKVVQYVLRHTWGFHEYDGTPKTITTDEFMYGRKRDDGTRMDKGTGLSNRSVIDGLVRAVADGYLIVHTDDSDKARIEKSYALKMTGFQVDVKKVHTENGCEESSQLAMKKVHSRVKNLHSDCEESSQRSEKETKERHFKKEREKDSIVPTITQKPPTLFVPETSSLSFSQKNASSFSSEEKPTQEKKTSQVDYELFDRLCRDKGYASDFKVPRNEKNNAAIQELKEQGANAEQVTFVFNDIWEDKDTFWVQHRGKPSTVASQFTARVWKMTAPAEKRRTVTGTTNWTEDRIGASAQEAKPVLETQAATTQSVPPAPKYRPKADQAPTYTRLKIDRPAARPRSLEARLRQAQKEL